MKYYNKLAQNVKGKELLFKSLESQLRFKLSQFRNMIQKGILLFKNAIDENALEVELDKLVVKKLITEN